MMIFGIPNRLRTDGIPQYKSIEFKEFCNHFKINHEISSSHHPQSNGHAEAVVKGMKDLVKKCWRNGNVDINQFNSAILSGGLHQSGLVYQSGYLEENSKL
uniref:Putative LOC101240642 [Hydra vulgaris] n=1 Tax=Lepeophtheirus salmonis TaxID=72036 RepID=A0A0K2THE5_LEPSM